MTNPILDNASPKILGHTISLIDQEIARWQSHGDTKEVARLREDRGTVAWALAICDYPEEEWRIVDQDDMEARGGPAYDFDS